MTKLSRNSISITQMFPTKNLSVNNIYFQFDLT